MTKSDLAANGSTSEIGTADEATSQSNWRYYPVTGKNKSVQAIVEGSLLAEIELVSIPEYGIVH